MQKRTDSVLRWLESFEAQNERWLLVLDGFPIDKLSLLEYLPQGGNGFILISTQQELSSDDIKIDVKCKMPELPRSKVRRLLLQLSEKTTPTPKEEHDAAELVDLLEGLPLAVNLAGAHLRLDRMMSIDSYIEEWRTQVFKPYPEGHRQSLGKTFQMTMETISSLDNEDAKSAHNLLRILSFFHHENIQARIFGNAWSHLRCVGSAVDNVQRLREMWISCPEPNTPWSPEKELRRFRGALGFLRRYCLLDLNVDTEDTEQLGGYANHVISVHSLVKAWAHGTMKEKEMIASFNKAANILAANAAAKVRNTDLVTHISNLQSEQPKEGSLTQTPCFFSNRPLLVPALLADFYSHKGYFNKALSLRLKTCQTLKNSNAIDTDKWLALANNYQDLSQHQNAFIWRVDALNASKHQTRMNSSEDSKRLHFQCRMAVAESKRQLGLYRKALEDNQDMHEFLKSNIPLLEDITHKSYQTMFNLFILPTTLNLGRSYLDVGMPEKTIEVLSKGIDTAQKCKVDSMNHCLLTCRAYLAAAYSEIGTHRKSLVERRAILQQRNLDDKKHSDTLIAKEDVARSLYDIDDRNEARHLREEVLGEWEELLSKGQIREDYPELLTAKMNLAGNLRDMGERGSAAKHYEAIYLCKKSAADFYHARRCTKNCGNPLFCPSTHIDYDVKEALEALEQMIFLYNGMSKRADSDRAKNILLRIWEEKLKVDPVREWEFLVLQNNLAKLLTNNIDKIASRTEILRKQMMKFRLEHISTLQTIASLVRNYFSVGDYGSTIKHGRLLEKDGEGLQVRFPREYREAMDAYRKAIAIVQRLPQAEINALDRRSRGVPGSTVSIIGIVYPSRPLPIRSPPAAQGARHWNMNSSANLAPWT